MPAKAVIPAEAGIHWRDVLRDSCRSLPPQFSGGGRNDGLVSRGIAAVAFAPSQFPQ